MKCLSCNRKLGDGQPVVPIHRVVGNERRGDFVSDPIGYVHLTCFGRYAGIA